MDDFMEQVEQLIEDLTAEEFLKLWDEAEAQDSEDERP